MNRISTKLTAYFFIAVLIMEVVLIAFLHKNIIESRVDEEFTRLLATGSNHRDVLLEYYSDTTMKHIVLMEKDDDREVVITNATGKTLYQSTTALDEQTSDFTIFQQPLLTTDEVLIANWKEAPYIVSAHPYEVDAGRSGYILMFQSTKAINDLIAKLNMYFTLAGATSIIALLIIYAVLSKFLTRPLIRMKEATEQLSEGNFNVALPFHGKDELGELAASIQKLANDLQHLKTERNEFLASVAHELSTPLTYLSGYSAVLMRQELGEKDRIHYLEILQEESSRMQEMVRNLLDLAKLDENNFTIKKEKITLTPYLEALQKRMTPSFSLHNTKLNLQIDGEFTVEADPIRLEQILLNLLDNALKYGHPNTVVNIRIYEENGDIAIEVQDEGIGIPAREIDYLFEKLYRVEKSRSRVSGGSGLGLAIVKELVEAHDGKIEVSSELGVGSTFTIWLKGVY